MAAHHVDRTEVMAAADLVGQHPAHPSMVDLKIRPAHRSAEIEGACAQPVGVDEHRCLKHDQSSSGRLSMSAGAPIDRGRFKERRDRDGISVQAARSGLIGRRWSIWMVGAPR
jgi:hypothetical protein